MSMNASTGIRQQDARTVLASVASNTYGRDMTFDFARNNWDKIVD